MSNKNYKKLLFAIVSFLSILLSECNKPASTRGGDNRQNEYIKWLTKISGDIISAGFSDVNGDKVPEIIVHASFDNDVVSYVLESKNGDLKSVVDRVVERGATEEGYGYFEFPIFPKDPYMPMVDIDGDGVDDWFTLDDYYINISDTRVSYLSPAVAALSGFGTLLWSNRINNPITSSDIPYLTSFWTFPRSVLMGGEGNDLIFYSVFTQRLCIVKGNTGIVKWCKEINSEGLSITDIDGDGNEDIISFSNHKIYDTNNNYFLPKLTALNGKDGEIIWFKEIDCEELNASTGDIDNDGKVEIIVSTGVPPGLKILDAVSGDEKYSFNLNMGDGSVKVIIDRIETSTVPILGDVDGDGWNDIVLQKIELGTKDTNGNGIWGDCVDINNSGEYEEGECDFSVRENYIFALNIQRGVLWKYENSPGDNNIFTFLIADIDDDGKNEVLSNYLGTEDNSDFELQAINGEDGSPAFWYGDFKDYSGYTSIKAVKLWGIGDIDSDGMLEILVTGSGCTEFCKDKVVMLLKTNAPIPASNSLIPWPLPLHDKYQSSNLH